MNADDKQFMAVVDLLHARDKIDRAIEDLKTGLPGGAISCCRFTLDKIGNAMEKIYRNR